VGEGEVSRLARGQKVIFRQEQAPGYYCTLGRLHITKVYHPFQKHQRKSFEIVYCKEIICV
jgi:hypothetical protein